MEKIDLNIEPYTILAIRCVCGGEFHHIAEVTQSQEPYKFEHYKCEQCNMAFVMKVAVFIEGRG